MCNADKITRTNVKQNEEYGETTSHAMGTTAVVGVWSMLSYICQNDTKTRRTDMHFFSLHLTTIIR